MSDSPTDPTLVERLARLGIFRDLSAEELAAAVSARQLLTFAEGVLIIRRGQPNTSLYVIVSGEAAVFIDDVERRLLARGSFFGEVSALLGEPATADIVSRSELHCLVVPAEEMEGFLVANPRIMFRMLQAEARRLRTSDEVRI